MERGVNKLIIIGIDNGKSGAICTLEANKSTLGISLRLIDCIDTPTTKNGTRREYDIGGIMLHLKKRSLSKAGKVIWCVEDSGESSRSKKPFANFSQGQSIGIYETAAWWISPDRFTSVNARTWQSAMFKGLDEKDTKLKAETICKRYLPELTTRTKRDKLLDGHCDAACLAIYTTFKEIG